MNEANQRAHYDLMIGQDYRSDKHMATFYNLIPEPETVGSTIIFSLFLHKYRFCTTLGSDIRGMGDPGYPFLRKKPVGCHFRNSGGNCLWMFHQRPVHASHRLEADGN